ncbi:MAG: alginate O-acetyltransferase [Clostridiales bacterium GWF2_36_10]|nr:MAG: alginate O-acetyltransferase [Clostridiales bacterium GWF2_36_10]HAN21236.1 membrane-bound O-acyltransferase family protein [Clostridiales bacterium]
MFFSDLIFLYLFLPVCLAAYFFTKKTRYRNFVLIGFSLFFYSWGEPVRVVLLILSSFINFVLARSIELNKKNKLGKASLIVALVYNIGMLCVFKYTDFVINNINGIFGSGISTLDIAFPIGISFYTFQALSYIIDVYWEKVNAQRKFSNLLMYISLFPNVTMGPIVRYETVENNLENRKTTVSDISEGLTRLIIGLAKKVIIANNLYAFVGIIFGTDITKATVAGTWIGLVAYSLNVYFDFSGYSDMAIGLARIFGFHYNENFNYPFMCRTIGEFWQRWHISLGSFFKDYLLYLPIFGKRRQYASLFLVWFTTGLWHGASWNYVIWGLYFGAFILIETKLGKKRIRETPTWLMHIYNKLVIIIGFGIFKFTNINDLGNFFKNLVGLNGNILINDHTITDIKSFLYIILIAVFFSFPILPWIKDILEKRSYLTRSAGQFFAMGSNVVLLAVTTILVIDTSLTDAPFLYTVF